MSEQTILFEVASGVATITLNRPDRLNSFTDEMHASLRDALKKARADASVRCLLLTGAGRGFCAGQDLSARKREPGAPPPDLGESIEKNYNPLVRTLQGLEIPVVCAVNGVAAGAGSSLALACDIVLAAASAKFIQSFVKVGLVPDSGATWMLPRLVGRARAAGMVMLGEPITAQQAEEWGLIWKCLPDEGLMDEARRIAGHLAMQPTKGLGYIKRALNAAQRNDLDQQLDLERDLQRLCSRTEDYREGVAAFMEKRAPKFEGR